MRFVDRLIRYARRRVGEIAESELQKRSNVKRKKAIPKGSEDSQERFRVSVSFVSSLSLERNWAVRAQAGGGELDR